MQVKRPHICGSLDDCRPEMLTYPPSVRGRWPRQPAYPCRISLLPHARYPTIPHQPTRAGPLSRVTPILSHRGDTSATGPTALGHPLAEERQERVNWAVALRVWKEKDSPQRGSSYPKFPGPCSEPYPTAQVRRSTASPLKSPDGIIPPFVQTRGWGRSILKTDRRVVLSVRPGRIHHPWIWLLSVAGSEMSWVGKLLSRYGKTETAR